MNERLEQLEIQMQWSAAQQRRRQLSLTQERMKEVLRYLPTIGRFRWRSGTGPGSRQAKRGLCAPADIIVSKWTE